MTIGIILDIGVCLIGLKIAQIKADQVVLIEAPSVLGEVEEKSFVFGFYEALKSYEVLPRS